MFSLLSIKYQLLVLCVTVCGVPIHDVSPQLLAAGGNRTTLRSQIATGLTSNANYRGTLDIFWSCVLTLAACIYTALHLNISPHTSKLSQLWRKVKWAATALVAPENVLYTAIQQFVEARDLVKQLNEQRFTENPPKKEQNISITSENISENTLEHAQHPPIFDLRYGFYATMGGFTVDVEKLHNKLSRVTLTPKGVISLAKQGFFLDVSPETISDKSKANIITKALICIQVLWMVIQCLARKAAGYPLALLEIHTMVHVFCALMLYILWWEKPLDINEPTIVDPPLEIIALMLMTTNKSSISGFKFRAVTGSIKAEIGILKGYEQPRSEPSPERAIGSAIESDLNDCPTISWRDDHGEMHPVKIYGQPLSSTDKPEFIRNTDPNILWTLRPGEFLESGFGPQSPYHISMSAKDVRRWELAYQVISKDKSFKEDFIQRKWIQTRSRCGDALTTHSPTMCREALVDLETSFRNLFQSDKNERLAFLALALLPVAYGGIHLAAWGFEFPSPAESLLWKISCLIIMSVFFIVILPIYVIWDITLRFPSGSTKTLDDIFATLILTLFIFYAVARIFLVLESFLSLRHVPIGVYAAVSWVQNIPHI